MADILDHNLLSGDVRYSANMNEIEKEMSKFQISQSVHFDTTVMDTLNDLENLPDSEFYKRLTDLKREHKKTLEFCEKLYNNKLSESKSYTLDHEPSNKHDPVAGINHFDGNYLSTSSFEYHNGKESDVFPQDHIKDMSAAAKPPTGRSKQSVDGTIKLGAQKSKRVWTGSGSEDSWKISRGNCSEADEHLTRSDNSRDQNHNSFNELFRQSYHSRIDDMWDNFTVKDYTPERLQMRQRSSSMSQLNTSSDSAQSKRSKSSTWKNCITIPKPFNFEKREANKTPKKTKAMEEMDKKRQEEIRKNEEECQKQFKARPVPAHVYMPLFDEIMEDKETKRKIAHQASKEILQSMQKPFKFDIREQEIKKFRSPSKSDSIDIYKKPQTTFKAKPFPEHLFANTLDDRLKEEEEYRKIRIQMRAEEMLFTSKLPANMGTRDKKFSEGKERLKIYAKQARKTGTNTEHKFRPKINGSVPDFEQLHNKFLMQAFLKKQQKEATVCKPFKLQTGNDLSKKHRIYDSNDKDEMGLEQHNRHKRFTTGSSSPLRNAALSTSIDSIPAKMTCAAQLRASTTKAKMQSKLEQELHELEQERQKKKREKELKSYIAERATTTHDYAGKSKKKQTEFKLAEKAQQEDYRQQLEEMKTRVQQRPLLFETTMQSNAARRAEKHYEETLAHAGVDAGLLTTGHNLELDSDGASDDGHYDYSSQHTTPRQYDEDSDSADDSDQPPDNNEHIDEQASDQLDI